MQNIRVLAVAVILLASILPHPGFLSAEDGQSGGEMGVRPTWERGYIRIDLKDEGLIAGRLDNPILREGMARLLKGKKLPTAVYAHGCSGLVRYRNIMGGHRRYIRLLAGAGFAVLIPDSFARKGRPQSCDPKRHRGIPGAPYRRIMEMRLEEIHYAAEQAGRFSWVDKENLFLMGHSQGGTAAARYSGLEFRAHIVSGSICRGGLRVPSGTPVLSIYSKNDPWLRGRSPDGCRNEARKRGRPIEFHLFPGDAHNLSKNGRARSLILDFLERHRIQR